MIYEWDEDDAPFWGRGCGDRCAIVSTYFFQSQPLETPPKAKKFRRKDNVSLKSDDSFQFSRFFNVVTHELCHTFHLDHCYYEYLCLMNSVDPVMESLDNSLPLCPCCLAKLHHVFRFEVAQRYETLMKYFSMFPHHFPNEIQWYSKNSK